VSSSGSSDESDGVDELYPDMTFPFMPGNCHTFLGNRRYLCWNDYAAVLLRNTDQGSMIDVHRGDGTEQSISNRGFTIAAIDEHGFLTASESEVVYRHHRTWAPDATTTIAFPREAVKLAACGKEWFAVATDRPALRLFTSAGL